MKISDIEVGGEYGVLDSPKARRYGRQETLPRKVRVLEIVTEEQSRRSGGGYGPSIKVNVRRVKVEMLTPRSASAPGASTVFPRGRFA